MKLQPWDLFIPAGLIITGIVILLVIAGCQEDALMPPADIKIERVPELGYEIVIEELISKGGVYRLSNNHPRDIARRAYADELGRLLAQETFNEYMANNFGSPNTAK